MNIYGIPRKTISEEKKKENIVLSFSFVRSIIFNNVLSIILTVFEKLNFCLLAQNLGNGATLETELCTDY